LGSQKPPIGNQVKLILIILSLLFIPSPLFGQSERPETIIIPVSSVGDVSDTRKQILQNTLTDELKKHFMIVPQEKYEQVLEQVFEELEYEECSEDTCIMRIQEMLQVENVFNLQIIGEGKDSQLNLKWITLDEKKNEEHYCEGCGTRELRKMIGGLVDKLVRGKTEEPVVVVSRDDEEELSKQREEMQEDEEDLKSLSAVNEIFQRRKYNLFAMYGSSDINIKKEPKSISRFINRLTYTGLGIGMNYYLWENYHINSNIFSGTLESISKDTPDISTTYYSSDVGGISDTKSSEFFDLFGENTYISVSFNRIWIYEKWNVWVGGGLYSETGSGTIITTNEKITTSFNLFGPLFDGGVDYNFENRLSLFLRMNGGLYTSSITQEVNNQKYDTDVNSSTKVYLGLGYLL